MKRCSTLFTIRKIHFNEVSYLNNQMAIIKKINLQTRNAGEDVEKKEPSYTAGGTVNWYSHRREQYRDSFLYTRGRFMLMYVKTNTIL